jgi:hypothetical protein
LGEEPKKEGRDRCIGFELLRSNVPDDFFARAHADPCRLEAEGWIRIRRGTPYAVDACAPLTLA